MAMQHDLAMGVIALTADLLGLVGMAGTYLVPARIFGLLKRIVLRIGNPASVEDFLLVWNFLLIAFALAIGMLELPRVFVCLWGETCSASRAGGLLHLAEFGAVVAIVELIWRISCAVTVALARAGAQR